MTHIITEIKKVEEWLERILADCKHSEAGKIKAEFYGMSQPVMVASAELPAVDVEPVKDAPEIVVATPDVIPTTEEKNNG